MTFGGASYAHTITGLSSSQLFRTITFGVQHLSLVDKTQARTLCPSWEEY